MNRFQRKRFELWRRFVTDEDVSDWEAFRHTYHWLVAEMLQRIVIRLKKRQQRHAKKLYEDVETLNFRKDLNRHL